MLRFIPLLLIGFACSSLSAQITLKVGDAAPKITPTEYLLNRTSKSNLKDKFLVLTLCKSWDQPCFNELPLLDSLQNTFAHDQVVFLSLFRGNPEAVQKQLEGKNFNLSLATDLNGATQIRYGDGETGLVGWPLTFLIDDQNVVRWQGDAEDLTVEALERFVEGQHPVNDLTGKYVPLAPDDFLFDPMTMKDIGTLWEADSVASFVRVWEWEDMFEGRYGAMHFKNFGIGAIGPARLEDIFQELFPQKRFVIPGEFMEKEYRVAFIQRTIDRETANRVAFGIIEELALGATVDSLTVTKYTLEITNERKFNQPRELSIKNTRPKGMKDRGSYNDVDLHKFEVRKYDLSGLAQLLNRYTPDRWRYVGNDRKKHNFILDVSSTEALLKSLAKHGIKAKGEAGTVEEITLERLR